MDAVRVKYKRRTNLNEEKLQTGLIKRESHAAQGYRKGNHTRNSGAALSPVVVVLRAGHPERPDGLKRQHRGLFPPQVFLRRRLVHGHALVAFHHDLQRHRPRRAGPQRDVPVG